MKFKKTIALALSCTMIAGCAVGFAACGGPKADITITFAHPITGPDSEFIQTLISNFNKENEGEIFIKDTARAEEDHYTNLSNSFRDRDTQDLVLIHKSRIPYYEHIGRINSMDGIIAEIGLNSADYVGDTWSSCEIEGSMYAVPYDVLPIVLFYNRKLFPKGKEAEWEAKIQSDEFTVADMNAMMAEVYKHSQRPTNKTYGMSFNYSSTDSMFISFFSQLGGSIVDPANPKNAVYNDAKGLMAAKTVESIAATVDKDGNKVCSESGSDHLNVYKQGRALFTIDGMWSAPGACDPENSEIDTGVVLLPKIDASVSARSVGGDGHCFATFNTAKNKLDEKREAAIAKFIQYMIEHSDYWCEGGKVAVRSDVKNSDSYKALTWSFLTDKLENDLIKAPEKVYTYSSIIEPLGKHLSDFIEKKPDAYKTWEAELDAAVKASKDIAAEIN